MLLLLVYTQTYPVCNLTDEFISSFRMFMLPLRKLFAPRGRSIKLEKIAQ